jgi:hypothetical protein
MNSRFVHISRTVGKMLGADQRSWFLLQYGERPGFLPLSGVGEYPLAGADRGRKFSPSEEKSSNGRE